MIPKILMNIEQEKYQFYIHPGKIAIIFPYI